MQLNCKPGDLAVIIRDLDAPENIGRLVTVIRSFLDGSEWYPSPVIDTRFSWEVKPVRKLIGWGRGGVLVDDSSNCSFPDADLRPIRDEPGVDESLLWAPVPNATKETESA